MILAGDVGGTKTNLGLFREEGDRLVRLRESRFPSRGFPSLEAMIAEFLSGEKRKVRRAAIGVAGPIVDGRSQTINLRWPVDARRLKRRLGVARVAVMNDLEATAWGIPRLTSRQFVALTPKLRGRRGTSALIAAGTGLGMAWMVPSPSGPMICASEGGHQDFAPRDDLEIELLQFLRERHGRVSTERVVAGPGLFALYQFLLEPRRGRSSAAMERRLAAADDPNPVIAEVGLAGEDALAERALDWFVALYGAAAGNIALACKAVGGVYIGGGIAPKILPRLRTGTFVRAFRNKGRLTPLLEKIPLRVILEPRTALIGAAARAAAEPEAASKPRSHSSKRST